MLNDGSSDAAWDGAQECDGLGLVNGGGRGEPAGLRTRDASDRKDQGLTQETESNNTSKQSLIRPTFILVRPAGPSFANCIFPPIPYNKTATAPPRLLLTFSIILHCLSWGLVSHCSSIVHISFKPIRVPADSLHSLLTTLVCHCCHLFRLSLSLYHGDLGISQSLPHQPTATFLTFTSWKSTTDRCRFTDTHCDPSIINNDIHSPYLPTSENAISSSCWPFLLSRSS